MDTRGKCLVIEDDQDIGELLKRILTQAGFDVRIERTGTGALTAAMEADFTLITLDLGLPDVDGTQISHLLRTYSSAPILVITARTTNHPDSYIAYPSAGCLFKPFRPAHLRDIINRLMPPDDPPMPAA